MPNSTPPATTATICQSFIAVEYADFSQAGRILVPNRSLISSTSAISPLTYGSTSSTGSGLRCRTGKSGATSPRGLSSYNNRCVVGLVPFDREEGTVETMTLDGAL